MRRKPIDTPTESIISDLNGLPAGTCHNPGCPVKVPPTIIEREDEFGKSRVCGYDL